MLVISALMNRGSITKRQTISMGTNIEILVKDHDADSANKAITGAFNEINRISDKYSTYEDDNLMAEINNSEDTLKVDGETFKLLQECRNYHEMTHGRFDPAVGKILRKMGFEGKGDKELPDPKEIRDVLESVGWKHVHLLNNNRVFIKKGVKLSFGAIAKGYAVDRAAEILKKHNIEKFLINAGGEIKAEGNDWMIGIQHPRKKGEILHKLVLNDVGIATSGDYEKYVKNKKGRKFSHIIDPVTGMPADECRSVSIIAENVIDADALATGIFVLGPEKGMKLIENIKGLEGIIVNNKGEEIKSTGFDIYIRS